MDPGRATPPPTNPTATTRTTRATRQPDYLIKVLARAAAKGGNVMLNMGPMGNGQIDPIDVEIFAGIGDWMDINEASIIDAGATTLQVHTWGESSLDGNRFYLHVFDWPEDGMIEIGGLKTDIKEAYMLADASKTPLQHTRIDETDCSPRTGWAPSPHLATRLW